MHTNNRSIVLVALLLILVPAGTAALLTLDDRRVARDDLREAIGDAASTYRQRGGLQSMQSHAERTLLENKRLLARLQREKRTLRLELGAMKRGITALQTEYGVDFSSQAVIRQGIDERARELSLLVQRAYRDERTAMHGSAEGLWLSGLLDESLASRTARQRETALILRARLAFLDDAKRTLAQRTALDEGLGRLSVLQQQYLVAQRTNDKTLAVVTESTARLEEIKRIMADVHEQVLHLQSELARIDARIKRKAERALIEKGLLAPREPRTGSTSPSDVQFHWPVYGSVSAGFRNEAYEAYFGVPHHGLDIVVAQSTPVAAAADGVVFLVRDGGDTGYTYVLIGHRGGYATLYGHLSAVQVAAGQDVDAGQIIGLSGGEPGTRGSGPMTTGAHLHFELINMAVNIDPAKVLP